MKILIIEDEIKLATFTQQGLQQAGHITRIANTGATGLEIAGASDFDLILLDLMLPGTNGFDVLKNLRDFGIDVPVIIISALNQSQHIIRGLDEGAVDYIKKPYDFDELLARIRTIQRMAGKHKTAILKNDDLTMNLTSHKVEREGKTIPLTQREFQLLEIFMRQPNTLLSKTQLAQRVWEVDYDMGSNVVEVHIHQLRKKIDKGFNYIMLETIIGAGYRLNVKSTNNFEQ